MAGPYYVDSSRPDDSGNGLSEGAAFRTLAYAINTGMAGSEVLYVKDRGSGAGAYSVANNASEAFPLVPKAGTSSLVPTRIIGYSSTIGDGGKPTIKLASSASTNVFTLSNNYVWLENFAIDAASQSSTSYHGVVLSGAFPVIKNLDIIGYAGYGVNQTGTTSIALVIGVRCHSAKAASSGGFAFTNAAARVLGCVADGVPGYGFLLQNRVVCVACIAYGCTGANGYGFLLNDAACWLDRCTAAGNAKSNIRINSSGVADGVMITNCLTTNSTEYGLISSNSFGSIDMPHINFNAFGGGASANTSGARSNVPAGVNDVTLSGAPFTSIGTDFSLVSTGAGAQCRAVGFPGAFPASLGTTGYLDIGAAQHADPVGGGGSGPLIGPGRLIR